jgi:hypothetical protein
MMNKENKTESDSWVAIFSGKGGSEGMTDVFNIYDEQRILATINLYNCGQEPYLVATADQFIEASRVARLMAAAPKMLAALKPFALLLQSHMHGDDSKGVFGIVGEREAIITLGDLRKAVIAVAEAEGKDNGGASCLRD